MNEAKTLLASLINDGVRISVTGENLAIDSPRGILTPQTKELIRRLKPDVLRLLQQQDQDRHYNEYVDAYNEKVERVLRDEDMFEQFNIVLDERIAIIEVNGNLSRPEAEAVATEAENIRQIVMNL